MSNTYVKYQPNVFLAKCQERHEKGDTILVETKYGKQNECIVYNLVVEGKDGFFYYSIVRADGFNFQEYNKKKAERLLGWAASAKRKSDEYYKKSKKDSDFLSLAEPIKVGHHSEKRHRKTIEQAQNNTSKFVEFYDAANDYEQRANYWLNRTEDINLSMPESLEFFEFKLEQAKKLHEGLKNGTIERSHSFSLTYAKKDVNGFTKKVELAKKLWV